MTMSASRQIFSKGTTIGYFFERDKLSFSLFFGPGGIIEQYLHTQPSAVYLYLSSYMAYSYDAYGAVLQVFSGAFAPSQQ